MTFMSEEQMAIRLKRTVESYSEARKRLGYLQAEAAAWSEQMASTAASLRVASRGAKPGDSSIGERLPTGAEVNQLFAAIEETREQIGSLRGSIQAMTGIEPKD